MTGQEFRDKLKDQGFTFEAAAAHMSCSVSTVERICRDRMKTVKAKYLKLMGWM